MIHVIASEPAMLCSLINFNFFHSFKHRKREVRLWMCFQKPILSHLNSAKCSKSSSNVSLTLKTMTALSITNYPRWRIELKQFHLNAVSWSDTTLVLMALITLQSSIWWLPIMFSSITIPHPSKSKLIGSVCKDIGIASECTCKCKHILHHVKLFN